MILTVLMFVVALCLSSVAAFYSIMGLTAIFAAAVMPIIIMGSLLEIAKVTVTIWLHEYWKNCKLIMKAYLSCSVVILMVITSMGIFGFLSKAHNDQGMVSGDVQAKIAIFDEKIKVSRENIDANRKALKQLDDAVDQVMGRSTDEKGADKAVALRRSQGKERARLIADIEAEQKKISQLNEERAPIAAEVRKVEAEVGPIKYIAALIYGDNPDANLLERAVRWVIIMLVVVFDPLAVMMLLAATESRKWNKSLTIAPVVEPPTQHDSDNDKKEQTDTFDITKHAYLFKPWVGFKNLKPLVWRPEKEQQTENLSTPVESQPLKATSDIHPDEFGDSESTIMKQAKTLWKNDNPGKTLKEQRLLLERGAIDHLPWEDYLDDPRIEHEVSFGRRLPSQANKGDQYILTSTQPSRLYKYNGKEWIEINKSDTDQYSYNQAYIEFLIGAISNGQYDPENLTDAERLQIESKLQQST